jgi:hypothetical protein
MELLFSVALVAIVGVVAWCVAEEGPFGAAITLLSVVFAGLLAMNFFEPVAAALEGTLKRYADVASLVGLFAVLVFAFRALTDKLAPTTIELDARVYQFGRWFFGAAAGYVTMAFLLTALHTAPLPRTFLGFKPERRNLFDVDAPDRRWLAFTQHVTEKILYNRRIFDGPQFQAPNTPQTVWPSFAIRYATRRQELLTGPKRQAAPISSGGSTSGGAGKGGAAF